MHFGFALDSLDVDLWNINLLDTHSDLLDTDIPRQNFVCLKDVLKPPSRHVFNRSLRHVFKTSSTEHFFVLKDVFKTYCEMSWIRLQNERCVEDGLHWRCVED